MGTFKIRPTQLVQIGYTYYPNIDSLPIAPNVKKYWYAATSLPDSPTIVQILSRQDLISMFGKLSVLLNIYGPQSFDDTLRFSFSGNSIYLDGSSTPISFSGLPVGWTPLTAILSIYPTPTTAENALFKQHFFLQLNQQTEGIQDSPSLAYSVPPSAIDLLNNGCGIRASMYVLNAIGDDSLELQELVIEGTYGISSTPQITQLDPTTPIYPGDKVKFIITSADSAGAAIQGNTVFGTFSDLTQIQFSWIDNSGNAQVISIDSDSHYIIVNNGNVLWFYLPIGFGSFSGTVTVTFVFDGTQFSGSVVIGTLQVLFEDASGIYVLVPSVGLSGQTNDLLYFRAGFITDTKLVMLSGITEDETIYKDDFFRQLSYPRRILAQDDIDDDLESSDFSMISTLRQAIVLVDTEIPSPFVKTAFLPE